MADPDKVSLFWKAVLGPLAGYADDVQGAWSKLTDAPEKAAEFLSNIDDEIRQASDASNVLGMILDEGGITGRVKDRKDSYFDAFDFDYGVSGLFDAIVRGVGLVGGHISLVSSLYSDAAREVRQAVVRDNYPPLEYAIRRCWLEGVDPCESTLPEWLEEFLRVQGIPRYWFCKAAYVLRTRLSATELDEARRRDVLSKDDYSDYLRKLGWQNETDRRMREQLTRRLLGTGDIVELARRGYKDDKYFYNYAGRLGLNGEDAEGLYHLSRTWLPLELVFSGANRGVIDDNKYRSYLRRLGYRDDDLERLDELRWQIPGPHDVISFAVREVYEAGYIERWGTDEFPGGEDNRRAFLADAERSGFRKEDADKFWRAHWVPPQIYQGYNMLRRGLIDREGLDDLFNAVDVIPGFRPKLRGLSWEIIPRRSFSRYVRYGALRAYLQDEFGFAGRQLDDSEMDVATEHYRKDGYRSEPYESLDGKWDENGDPAGGQIDQGRLMVEGERLRRHISDRGKVRRAAIYAYRDGFINEQTFRHYLRDLNYSEPDIDIYYANAVRLRQLAILTRTASPDQQDADEARRESKADILNGYKEGMLDRREATDALVKIGFSAEAVEYLLAHEDYERQRDYLGEVAGMLKDQFMADLLDEGTAESRLIGEGFAQPEAARRVGLWRLERQTRKKLDRVRDRLPTLTDLRDWLTNHVITVETWRDYMARLGYPDETIELYLHEIVVRYL